MLERQLNGTQLQKPSSVTIEQLEGIIKALDTCIVLLSRKLLPEKAMNIGCHTLISLMNLCVIKLLTDQEMFYEEKIHFGIGWSLFLGAALFGAHALLEYLHRDTLSMTLVSSLTQREQEKFQQSLKITGIPLASDLIPHQIQHLQHKKQELKNMITDRKAWQTFSIYNHSKNLMPKAISHCVEEFLFPKKLHH